jgi:hypothetical protein
VLTSADADLVSQHLSALRTSRDTVARSTPTVSRTPTAPRASGLPAALRPDGGFPMREWRYIIVHHSATPTGAAKSIDLIHRRNGWDGLGYHFVVGNGTESGDGQVEVGFRWRQQRVGAHARRDPADDNFWNRHAIGICLVGNFMKLEPSDPQFDALVRLVRQLREEYGIPADHVRPHSSVVNTHCPGARFPWSELMSRIR